jgi:hypothetical protein
VDKVPVSELCEELGLRPTVFYRWQKELFENGAAAFQSQERPHRQVEEKQKRIEFLEAVGLLLAVQPVYVFVVVDEDRAIAVVDGAAFVAGSCDLISF